MTVQLWESVKYCSDKWEKARGFQLFLPAPTFLPSLSSSFSDHLYQSVRGHILVEMTGSGTCRPLPDSGTSGKPRHIAETRFLPLQNGLGSLVAQAVVGTRQC